MRAKRIFLIVLDSFGIGEMPDAANFGDAGSNTIGAVSASPLFDVPNMESLGLFAIDGVKCQGKYGLGQVRDRQIQEKMSLKGESESAVSGVKAKANKPQILGTYGRLTEKSKGKDTTIGHWEIAGCVSQNPLPVYPDGFPDEVIRPFKKATGRGVLCNKPYSGTEVIKDYGRQHMESGDLIVYTSADSVFQIAAHEDVVPVAQLYRYCEAARKILQGKHGVGRVIARPFTGQYPNFKRTVRRHDFSLTPPEETVLDKLQKAGFDTIGVGKIYDIFAGRGIGETYRTAGNADGMEKTMMIAEKDFRGLCFVNLVDFDMLYGHRNDVDGYAKALTAFDIWLGKFMAQMKPDDMLMITADHGCDPSTPSTDHSREYVPLLVYGDMISKGKNLGTLDSYSAIADMIGENFGC